MLVFFSCSTNKYGMCQTAGAGDGSSLFAEQMLYVCARLDCCIPSSSMALAKEKEKNNFADISYIVVLKPLSEEQPQVEAAHMCHICTTTFIWKCRSKLAVTL